MDSGKRTSVGHQGKAAPVSQLIRKSAAMAAEAVDSYICLFTTKAAQAKDSCEYETVLFLLVTPNGTLATARKKKRGAKRRIQIVASNQLVTGGMTLIRSAVVMAWPGVVRQQVVRRVW